MKFSYNAVWDLTVSLLRAHFAFAGAIAGVFIFLPTVLLGHLMPVPQGGGTDPQADADLMIGYLSSTWHWQIIAAVVTFVGILAILVLVLDRGRPTVGTALGNAIRVLPFYLLGTLIIGVALIVALVVCITVVTLVAAAGSPSLMFVGVFAASVIMAYFTGRFAVFAPVASVEHRTPIGSVRRALELTKGHGWAIFGFLFLIVLAGGFASLTVSFVFGGLFRLLLSPELADLLILLVGSAVSTVLAIVLVLATASIYSALSSTETTASLFE